MNQMRSGSGAPPAVLAGSLAAFGLLDVLRLLDRTRHAGELQVVGDGVEAHLWIDGGDLLDRRGTAADRLFELACLDDAWFTVTAVPPPDRIVADTDRIALGPLIDRVAPHVAEWHSLVEVLPFGAVARMAPTMPGAEVQIRADQWRILSLIGAGRPVHEVIDVSDSRPLETLRLVHELSEQRLISIEPATPETDSAEHHARPTTRRSATAEGTDEHPGAEPIRLVPVGASPGGASAWRRGGASVTVNAAHAAGNARTTSQPSPSHPSASYRGHGTAAPPAVYMPPPLAPGLWPPADGGGPGAASASDG